MKTFNYRVFIDSDLSIGLRGGVLKASVTLESEGLPPDNDVNDFMREKLRELYDGATNVSVITESEYQAMRTAHG